MRIRLKQERPEVEQYDDLKTGYVYTVIGIEADDYRIVNLDGKPFLYPASLFDVLDPTEPKDWVTEFGDDGEKYAYPPQLATPGFFEDYFEGKPEAVATFDEHVRKRLP